MTRSNRAFIKNRWPTQNTNATKRGVYYIGVDSMDVAKNTELQKKWFGPEEDLVNDPRPFIERIQNHRALKHPKATKSHHLIFSLRKVDYTAYKRSGRDYKDIVRGVLESYEKKHGVKLDWLAHIHDGDKSDSHPHCHIIIKAVSDNLGDRGYKRVKFVGEDMVNMRNTFEQELDRHSRYKFMERENIDQISKDFSKSFESVMYNIAQEAEKKKREGEFERESKRKSKGRHR